MSKQGLPGPNPLKELIVDALGAHKGGAGSDELRDGLTLQKKREKKTGLTYSKNTHILSDSMSVTLAVTTRVCFLSTGHCSTPGWRSALAHHPLHNVRSETRGSGSCYEGKRVRMFTRFMLHILYS